MITDPDAKCPHCGAAMNPAPVSVKFNRRTSVRAAVYLPECAYVGGVPNADSSGKPFCKWVGKAVTA